MNSYKGIISRKEEEISKLRKDNLNLADSYETAISLKENEISKLQKEYSKLKREVISLKQENKKTLEDSSFISSIKGCFDSSFISSIKGRFNTGCIIWVILWMMIFLFANLFNL